MEAIIKMFLEENWPEYLEHCRQHGIEDEAEIEADTDEALKS